MRTSTVGCYFAGGAQSGSAAQMVYFFKPNIEELKVGLNFKGISVSHSPEVR